MHSHQSSHFSALRIGSHGAPLELVPSELAEGTGPVTPLKEVLNPTQANLAEPELQQSHLPGIPEAKVPEIDIIKRPGYHLTPREYAFQHTLASYLLSEGHTAERVVAANSALELRDSLSCFADLTASQRKVFTDSFVDLALRCSDTRSNLIRFAHNIVPQLSTTEIAVLIKKVADSLDGNKERYSREKCRDVVEALLRGVPDLEQLSAVVRAVGVRKLVTLGGNRIENCVTASVLVPRLMKCRIPNLPAAGARRREMARYAGELTYAIETRLEIIDSAIDIRKTEMARRIRTALTEEIRQIRNGLRKAARPGELAGLFQLVRAKVEFSTLTGIVLAVEKDRAGRPLRAWQTEQVKELLSGYRRLPRVAVLTARPVREICRTAGIKGFEMCVDLIKRSIEFPDNVTVAKDLRCEDGTARAVQNYFVHELGHMIQIGVTERVVIHPDTGELREGGELHYDFQDWCRLSGWHGVPRGQYKLVEKGLGVRINGTSHPLGKAEQFKGESVSFQWGEYEGELFYHRANSRFPPRPHGWTTPWEDFAESFALYCLSPAKLMDYAPEKFRFLEVHFGYGIKRKPTTSARTKS